ncbi:hypothetical protein SAMN00790413_00114 [Deinococcus hopiensis KR-140]|uniref:Uncharacterized protein n=1 Tax=Deinococcus hopiensis KR-140 TaxID=695939 RepID=A0A1W1V5N6_9DEIO|nr:hypothetical protein SAMN00790413_00114 [Deinococcus hopiensis KR-140]
MRQPVRGEFAGKSRIWGVRKGMGTGPSTPAGNRMGAAPPPPCIPASRPVAAREKAASRYSWFRAKLRMPASWLGLSSRGETLGAQPLSSAQQFGTA